MINDDTKQVDSYSELTSEKIKEITKDLLGIPSKNSSIISIEDYNKHPEKYIVTKIKINASEIIKNFENALKNE